MIIGTTDATTSTLVKVPKGRKDLLLVVDKGRWGRNPEEERHQGKERNQWEGGHQGKERNQCAGGHQGKERNQFEGGHQGKGRYQGEEGHQGKGRYHREVRQNRRMVEEDPRDGARHHPALLRHPWARDAFRVPA